MFTIHYNTWLDFVKVMIKPVRHFFKHPNKPLKIAYFGQDRTNADISGLH